MKLPYCWFHWTFHSTTDKINQFFTWLILHLNWLDFLRLSSVVQFWKRLTYDWSSRKETSHFHISSSIFHDWPRLTFSGSTSLVFYFIVAWKNNWWAIYNNLSPLKQCITYIHTLYLSRWLPRVSRLKLKLNRMEQ